MNKILCNTGNGCVVNDANNQAAKAALTALGSTIPKPEFIDLLAGFEYFTKTGTALPDETVR